jgi:hypothetical protein
MDEAIELLRRFVELECRARQANYTEPDDRKFLELVRAWDKLYGGELRSGLSRPTAPAATYADPDHVAAGARQRPRTIFAVARYQLDGSDVYRAWMGDTELGRRGESMPQSFYLTSGDGGLKVVAIYRVCSACLGTGIEDGEPCSTCGEAGWLHGRGVEWPPLGAPLEVRKLAPPPSDPLFKPAYEAIPQP